MKDEKIAEKVREIIRDNLHVRFDEIGDSCDLIAHLGADSLDVVSMQISLENEFDIEIPEDVANELNTVGDYIECVKKRIK